MTLDAPDRLDRRSYPHIFRVSIEPHCNLNRDLSCWLEQARVVVTARILEQACREAESSRLSLAFKTIAQSEIPPVIRELEAGAGVLDVTSSSVRIAIGLFAEGRCIAIEDSVLLHVGTEGQCPWSPEAETILNSLAWRYGGAGPAKTAN